jgi:hypothetical protein
VGEPLARILLDSFDQGLYGFSIDAVEASRRASSEHRPRHHGAAAAACELADRHLSDSRRGKNIQLPPADLLRQSIKHARYYWLLLAESHLTRRLFAGMLRKIAGLPSPAG